MIAPLFGSITRPLLSPLVSGLRDELFGAFTPRSLFNDGSIGVLYDNNDLTTMFVDAAGTTPATVNGLVGLQLDKSQGQIVSRKNLSSYTEQFDNAIHAKINSTISTNTAVAPDGTTTADTLLDNATAGGHSKQAASALSSVGTNYVYSIYAKAATASRVMVYGLNAVGARGVGVDLTNGSTFTVSGITLETSAVITDVGSGWYRISIPVTPVSTATQALGGVYTVSGTSFSYSGTGTGVYIWGEQLEVGTSATAYQRVVTGFGDWMAGNHRYQATTGSKPILRGTPTGAELFTAYGTPGAGWSVAGATGTATTASSALPTTTAATVGKHYRVTYTVTRSAGSVQLSFGGRTGVSRSAAGQYVEYFDNALNTNALTVTGTGFTGTVRIDEVKDVSAGSVTAPYGLQYDGVDDFLQTTSVNFSATDKMFVCAGVRKLSDATRGMLAELTTSSVNNGSFSLDAPPVDGATSYRVGARGTAGVEATAAGYAAQNTHVLQASINLAGASSATQVTARINGSAVSLSYAGTTGSTGSFANAVLYFGRRAGTSLPFNGLDFGFVIVGKTLTAAQISSTERYIAQRTGVSF